MIQKMIKCLGHRVVLVVVLLVLSSFVMKECPAALTKKQIEKLLEDRGMYRPARGWVKIIDYKPHYSGGKSYKLNNIPDLFEAIYHATPTLGHADFPDNQSYTPQKKDENQAIRDHFKTVYLQAEQDALDMIRKFDNSGDFVQIEHWDRLSALSYSVLLERKKLVQAMLDKNISEKLINQIGEGNRRTPLSLAVNRDNEDIIKMLVDAGADPNIESEYDSSPIVAVRIKINHEKEYVKKYKNLLEDNGKMFSSWQESPYKKDDNIKLEEYRKLVKEWLDYRTSRLDKQKRILKIFESFSNSTKTDAPGKNFEESPLQKSLSTLEKELNQLKEGLKVLANNLVILNKKFSKKS